MAATIPRYALYGESDGPAPSAFVHIETIVARSALNDWEIKPHSHSNFVQLLLIQSGNVHALLDGEAHEPGARSVIIAPSLTVHGFRFLPGTQGVVLTLSRDFLLRDPLGLNAISGAPRAEPIPPAIARRLAGLAREMLRVQREERQGHEALALALAESIVRLVGQAIETGTSPAQWLTPAAERLRNLIDTHFRAEHRLSFYAVEMAMTERTMSRLCHSHFGCAPQLLLHRRLVTEATRLLHYSNAQVAQIAEELGFSDPSYFSRFYLRMTGQRPRAHLRYNEQRAPPSPHGAAG